MKSALKHRLRFPLLDFKTNLKLQGFVLFSILLFGFRLVFSPIDSIFFQLINEVLVGLIVASLLFYLIDVLGEKTINPMSLVMNVGILNAFIFFLIMFSDLILSALFDNVSEAINRPGLAYFLVSFTYVFLNLIFISYIFLSFKEFYFLKRNRRMTTYFNTMVVFFILYSASSLLNGNENLTYVKNTFLIISILLIVINSIKISWIAFIVKREKISLLILSAVISVLFIFNLIHMIESAHTKVMLSFSPAFDQFMMITMLYGAIYFGVLFFTTLFHLPTAEAFDRKAQEVSSLQYFSKLITQVLDFKELTETVAELGAKISNADSSWIVWQTAADKKILSNNRIGFIDAEMLTEEIFNQKTPKKFEETSILQLKKLIGENSIENYSSVVVSPLRAYNEQQGFLIVAKKGNFIFDDDDIDAIKTFSDYASVALENSRLLEESIEKERLEKELDVARVIQRKIIPAKDPEIKNLNISSVFIPAFEVGGDYYDFFEISNTKLGFIIADVSGKGISAAFIMAEIKGIFESLSKEFNSPKEILIKANDILKRTLDRKTFVSAAFGIIDIEKEELSLARAGHCPLALIRNNTVKNLRPRGIGLGLVQGNYFISTLEEIKIDLVENDLLVLYTDGITEAKNTSMEDFGDILFEKILLENADKNVDEIANKVISGVTLFANESSQHDDITLVILKWKQKIKIDGEEEWQNSTPQLQTKVK